MTACLTPSEWIRAIDEHYLAEFIPGGGSAVKFVACSAEVDQRHLIQEFDATARSRYMLSAMVDSAHVKLQSVEQLFSCIAGQIPWRQLTDRVLMRFARECHWRVPECFASSGVVEQLSQLNDIDVPQISLDLQRRIGSQILLNRTLAKDFRTAMHWMAKSRLESDADGETTRNVMEDWLCGRISKMSELKQYQIFDKVLRSNARHLLASLATWIRFVGFSGFVLNIDAFRLLETVRPSDGSVFYTPAALLDAYEVIREFIDGTDNIDGLLMVVFAPSEFTNIDPRSRGLGKWPALSQRVYDEVRGSHHANPLAALTRVALASEALS